MTHAEVMEDMAGRAQQRLALLMTLAVLASMALALPFASLPLQALPHVSGIYGAATAMIDLATFWLLASAPRQPRSHAILAAAYLFAGLMAVLHVLTFPGAVFPGQPVLGSPHAVSLLFIAWRAGFAAFVFWAVLVAGRETAPGPRQAGSAPILIALLATVAAFAVSQWSDAAALSTVAGRQMFSDVSRHGSYASAAFAALATALIGLRGLFRRSLFVWLVFVLMAEAAGVWLSTFSGGRYTLAWYVTRAEGLVASTVVLVVLARHFRSLQLDLAETVTMLQGRTEALQAEIHRRERAEAHLAQAKKLEAVGQLGAGLAHDLNNILQVVTGRLSILQRRAGEVVDADVAVIRRNVRKGEALTRQLTLLSGRRSLNARPLDPATVLPEIAEGLRALLAPRHEVRLSLETPLPGIEADPLELEIALTNLATNARDAMPDGGTVEIAASRSAAAGRASLVLRVRDSGAGMAPELLERVFEPFFTTKEPGRGTGLGLPQVYGFVSASGGAIEVDSAPGRGTTVTMTFPVDDAKAAGHAETVPSDGLRAGQVVLLVDDNDDVREASAQLLAAGGWVVRSARNATEALALLEGELRADVMISDVVMPGGIDGVALARRARGLKPDLRVVLVTGYSDAAATASAEGLPVIRKPYDLAALGRALQ
ncbi:ATP-binding protein [Mitsuaria sp. GD03876]|uniref:ATP-binding protein n=1 Tax=Mitsuaria sp. GD03876 TaxID=2975399 RepID=UPI002448C0E6|nr:ATP-binding protein [Mitsuaria sp. GD03876]MDH0866494.1 ATP-binding protein [Mitsuaria sp. GD03876]